MVKKTYLIYEIFAIFVPKSIYIGRYFQRLLQQLQLCTIAETTLRPNQRSLPSHQNLKYDITVGTVEFIDQGITVISGRFLGNY